MTTETDKAREACRQVALEVLSSLPYTELEILPLPPLKSNEAAIQRAAEEVAGALLPTCRPGLAELERQARAEAAHKQEQAELEALRRHIARIGEAVAPPEVDLDAVLAAAAEEYNRFGTGSDTRRPHERQNWVGRVNEAGRWVETTAHASEHEAALAAHHQGLAAAIRTALAAAGVQLPSPKPEA